MRDDLGDRIKASYENRTRFYLPRRTYTIIRVDGKAFHSFTQGCQRPFDRELMATMDATAWKLCQEISGARFAYVQSDEISVLLTDFDTPQTQAWFDGNLQKLCSLSASLATATFNGCSMGQLGKGGPAMFDSRVFTIPHPVEVANYFIWRQQDAVRNSIQMAGQAHFCQKQLEGVSCDKIQDMLFREKGINWNDYPAGCKRGRCVVRETVVKPVEYEDKRTHQIVVTDPVVRSVWSVVEPPIFAQDRYWLISRIPVYEELAL